MKQKISAGKAAYLGPQGTFSHQAALSCFTDTTELIPCSSIEESFRSTEGLQTNYSIVPVENSAQGSVTFTMDSCIRTRLNICGEFVLKIRHALLSTGQSLSDIDHIYSHPQPLLQCRNWLLSNFPHVTQEAVSSTAEAARRASENPNSAAIGSPMLAELYHISILQQDLQDAKDNYTRFWIMGQQSPEVSAHDKTSIWFITPHKPGALFDVLKIFSETKVNITRIESRPYPGKAWEYVFFLDMEGHQHSDNLREAFHRLSTCVEHYRVLGSYPAAT